MSTKMGDNWIGTLNFEACEDCEHSDPEEGGCAVWRPIVELEDDYVACMDYSPRKSGDDKAKPPESPE